MKKIFYVGVLFLAASCSSGGNADNHSDSATTNMEKGNSPGSNIIQMDTMHMDTSGQKMLSDSTHH